MNATNQRDDTMTKVILANAFSLNMLGALDGAPYNPGAFGLSIRPVDVERVREILADGGFESAVGHADTAGLFEALLGLPVACNRATITLPSTNHDEEVLLIVGQYSGPRLPEGATALPEGATITWMVVRRLSPGAHGEAMDGHPVWWGY
jgi:hypothetical protein